MDNSNWRPTQAEPSMDGVDWRTQLQPDSRHRIVNKIMETLKRHLPISGPEGINELKKIAVRFEEKIYSAATSQSDYLRRISVKMLTMETKSQNTGVPNSLPSNSTGNQKPPDSAHSMQSQVPNQVQLPISLPNQAHGQARQQLLSQNIQNTVAFTGVQSSASLQSALPPVTSLTQTTMQNGVGQSSNSQNISGISQNSVGQGIPSNMLANSQRQMQGRQLPQQQPPNSQQYTYQQQQLHQQLLKLKLQQGNIQLG